MYEAACDVAVIGAGPAGLAAAVAAREQGAGDVLIIERDSAPGGILQQCIHAGFGLKLFGEELTGPEYASRFILRSADAGVRMMLNAMALDVSPQGEVVCVSGDRGVCAIRAKSVVLAMGCRERTRGSLVIPGARPAGIYTAGAAQRLINRQNLMVGRKAVILGSGDVGMIMARRLTLEGVQVAAVVEILGYVAGLTRNRVQCLEDHGIPLLLSHSVTGIAGNTRVEGVYVEQMDEERRPVPGTRRYIECDTLLLSVGLIPENELSRAAGVAISPATGGPVVNQYMQTSVPCMFACGNVAHVNDLVDHVSMESEIAGRAAARYAMGSLPPSAGRINCLAGENVRYVCPQVLALTQPQGELRLYLRVIEPAANVRIRARGADGAPLYDKKAARVNPGEMVFVTIDSRKLTACDIRIDVTEENL